MKSAVERFWEAVPEQVEGKPVDGAILTSAANCRYLSGFPSSSRLVILTREQAYFLTDFRYGEAARKKVRDCQVVVFQRKEQSVKEILRRHGLKTVLFERETIPLVEAETLGGLCREEGIAPIFDNTLDKTMESIRAIKTPEEIDKIRAAQAITDEAFSHILPFLREGVTEREIALEIEFFMRKQGAERIAFDLIVVSGENGSQCHGVPTDKPLRRGDFITMDTGGGVRRLPFRYDPHGGAGRSERGTAPRIRHGAAGPARSHRHGAGRGALPHCGPRGPVDH